MIPPEAVTGALPTKQSQMQFISISCVNIIKLIQVLNKDPNENPMHLQYSDEIATTKDCLKALIVALVDQKNEKASRQAFIDAEQEFKRQVVDNGTLSNRIEFLVHHQPVQEAFEGLVSLKKAVTAPSLPQMYSFVKFGTALKEHYRKYTSDDPSSLTGEHVWSSLEKFAVEAVPLPSQGPRGYRGEQMAQISGMPGLQQGHWYGSSVPVLTDPEPVSILSKRYASFPINIQKGIEKFCAECVREIELQNRAPTQAVATFQDREGRFGMTFIPIPSAQNRIAQAFEHLLLREISNDRAHTSGEAMQFLTGFLKTHPIFHTHLKQLTGWGPETKECTALMTQILEEVIEQHVKEGDFKS